MRLFGNGALAIYLNDHLAGATAACELARRAAANNRANAYGPVLAELAEETQHVLAFTPGDGWDLSELAAEIPLGDRIPEHALGLLYLPLLQLLAYHRALHKGVNPDESRNLTSYIELPEGG